MSDAQYMVDKLQHTVNVRDYLLIEYGTNTDTDMAETLRTMIDVLNERINIYENSLRRCRIEYWIETKHHFNTTTNQHTALHFAYPH
jgi:hypothetical protein